MLPSNVHTYSLRYHSKLNFPLFLILAIIKLLFQQAMVFKSILRLVYLNNKLRNKSTGSLCNKFEKNIIILVSNFN